MSDQSISKTTVKNNNGKYLNVPNADHGVKDHKRNSSSSSGQFSSMEMTLIDNISKRSSLSDLSFSDRNQRDG